MNLITAPINENSPVPTIQNLQDGLLRLLQWFQSEGARESLLEEQRSRRYGGITKELIANFQIRSELEGTGYVDRPTADAMNRLLREFGALDELDRFVVRGILRLSDNTPVPGVEIRAFDRDLRSRELLGKTTTNSDGYYEITYTRDQFNRAEKQTADLIVAAVEPIFAAVAQYRTIVESPTLFNAPANAEIDLTIAAEIFQPPSEYVRLIQTLDGLLVNVSIVNIADPTLIDKLADLNDEDLDFLFHETNIELEKLQFLTQSARLHQQFVRQDFSVPVPAFYGLARTKRINDLDGFARTSISELKDGLIQAGGIPNKPQQNIIAPFGSEEQLDRIIETIHSVAIDHARSTSIQTKITDLKDAVGELLQPILDSEEKLQVFLDAYARHDGAIEDFWQTMSQNEQFQADIPRIQLNLQLSQLTLNNKGLVSALQQRDITNTRQLVDLSTENWEALSFAHIAEIPPHITGENDLERSRLYAQELQTLVEIAFPTEVIKKHVQHPATHTFLNNNPGFDFTSTPVDTYLQGREQAFEGIENPDVVSTQLRQMQRMYTLTANATDMNNLMALNYESAQQISKLSVEDFTRSVADRISAENAYLYHAKAIAVSDASVMVHQQLRDLAISFAPDAAKNLSGNLNALRTIPNWENLFGSLDMCECQHCKSVYSPAAYFVDLLNILLGQNNGAARKELFRRRPDLMYTKLSCEHTETLIPYIDLVNEVLETYVAQDHIGNVEARNHAAISTNDTSRLSASDLSANPQHPNQESAKDAQRAYDLLKNAVFPLNLPFDMDLEVARQFLQEQNSNRFAVMKTFGNATSYATSAERLGLSQREFEILTLKQLDGTSNAKFNSTTDILTIHLWGNPAIPAGQSLGEVLANVQTFIDRTNIHYTDLISLLKIRFLNPNFPINAYLQELSEGDRTAWLAAHPDEDRIALSVIELAGDVNAPCDLSKTQIRHLNGEFLSDNELSRFNRFIRLWKKLGCTIAELDNLLTAFGATDLTPEAIQNLSALWQIKQDLNLSCAQAAVLIGNIPTTGKDSLFAKLFLNKAILQIDDKFALNVSQTELDNTAEFFQDHVPAILAAFRISQEDLDRIVSYTNLSLLTDTLTLANLSKIYRYVVFAKGFGIKIKDLRTWFDLMPQSPWVTVAELANTQERLASIQRYGFKAADFAYVFRDRKVAGHALPVSEDMLNQSAKTLREGLLKVRQENTPKDGIVTTDFLTIELGILLIDLKEVTKVVGILDGSNTQDTFDYLLTPQVPDSYKDILQNYLTAADITDLIATADSAERLSKYWTKIEIKLLPVLQKIFIQQHLTATFKAEAALVALILQDAAILQACLDVEVDTPAHLQAYVEQYRLVHKFTWLVEQLQLSAKNLTYFQNNANFGNFNWKDFNFPVWLRIADFVALRNALPPAEKSLLSIFETANNGGDVAKAIADITAWDRANVEYFVSRRTAADFLNEISLILLQQQIELSQQIGVSIEKLESWAGDVLTPEQSQDIKRSLKAKYDETAWIEVSTQVHNRLRSHLRDALVAYLLQKFQTSGIKELEQIKSPNDLYGYFSLDVEMDACMQTSRLKQAIASVQLFVQRCLLNLETGKANPTQNVSPSAIDAKQWKWMKNYRVWEANRKVFLYPENWIEPELRDNKSPFFKELESELLQGEVTNESVEKALMNYLEKLHDVARLDVCGLYEDTEAQELHVFGRTFNAPPQYFYRKLDLKTQFWTPWERIQLDIQGNEEGDSAGVHLIPVVWNRRLYLFWPIFTEKSDREKIQQDKEDYKRWKNNLDRWKEEVAKVRDWNNYIDRYNEDVDRRNRNGESLFRLPREPLPPKPAELEPIMETYPWAYWEVRLAWSEYKNKKWSSKKVSQSFIRTPSDRYGVAATYIYRFSLVLGSTLKIKLLYHPSMLIPMGEYQLNCNGRLTVFSSNDNPVALTVIDPKQVNFYQGFLSARNSGRAILWHEQNSFLLDLVNNGKSKKNILSSSEEEYKLLFSADHNFSNNSSSRFIYQDRKRNYYVESHSYWYERAIPSVRDPWKVAIPRSRFEMISPLKLIDKGDPAPNERSERFKQLSSATISQIVEKGQIEASTAMQIRSMQTLAAPSLAALETKSLSFMAATVGQTYLNFRASTKLQFKSFFHAYVCKFMEALDKTGTEGLLNLYNQQFSDLQLTLTPGGIAGGLIPTGVTNNFEKVYRPNRDNVENPYPIEDVDFSLAGAYSLYNWELFFHIPMLLANRLSKNQRFEEAMRWYHFVFNPTTNDPLNSSARYWQVIPLRNTPQETLDSLFKQLHNSAGDSKRKELEAAIAAWRSSPFNPHLIARMRLSAYQKNAVMKYLDNSIAWADNLFRQDTIESINEATQLYILAAELLGKRPEKVPARGKIQAFNYAELEAQGLDAFSNTLVKLETIFPFFNLQAVQQGVQGTASILNTTVPSWYFCLPDNDKLLGYWDTVADRLFKIRHCQNIEGMERQLALFEPPIDPALLVQAVAGGVDISSVLADLNSPLPYYRFSYIVQKALEICSELQSLGNSLLSALEKRDSETLSILRSHHETLLLELAKTVKKLQITEAQRNREGLEQTQEVTKTRFDYYSELINIRLIEAEKEYSKKLEVAKDRQDDAYGVELAANIAHIIPNFNFPAFGGSFGGSNVGSALNAWARSINYVASGYTYEANRSSTNASNERRLKEWIFQQSIAKKELAQIDKQILAAQIREKISQQELINHEQQIDDARQIEDFFRNKYTQEELYGWMVGEISTIYFQCYQLAYDLAKKAEKTYRYELGLPTSNFIQFGIWDSFRKGLMSGERLYLSLKQMEKSYMDRNRREYEIAKHISLLQLKPLALIALKETGTCTIELPEALFDADYPGHYMRRIKSVSLTIPCVVGPYTSINCTLTLLSSETRIKSTPASPYNKKPDGDDDRFITNFAAMQSIATSTAQNDSGLFELNFRDERYLPFEYAGAVSRWRIDLPEDCNAFDFDSISDVILRLSYTAREGGATLKNEAKTAMNNAFKEAEKAPLSRLFSTKHEFPSEWHQFLNATSSIATLNLDLSLERFPFQFRGKKLEIQKVELFLPLKEGKKLGSEDTYTNIYTTAPLKISLKSASGTAIEKTLTSSPSFLNGIPHVMIEENAVPTMVKNGTAFIWSLTADTAKLKQVQEAIADLLIVCHYTVT
jgi:Tc toxin complex TcA C-terminal TcB-binding domain/Neuraminidase-like domain/Salmonella virulence plasmid 28.1kDa A protein